MSERFDAIVVGAGPAGSTAALLLARAGLHVALLDRARLPRDVVCGEFVSEEGVAVLDACGVELAGSARIAGFRLHTMSGEVFSRGTPRGIGLARRPLDSRIATSAARAGATLRDRVTVEAPVLERGRARGVRVRLADGRVEEWRAPVIAAADGRHSALARALSLRQPNRHPGPHGLYGFRGHLDLASPAPVQSPVELFVFDGGYAGLCTIGERRVNLAFVAERRILQRRSIREILEGNDALRARLQGVTLPERFQSVGPLEAGRRSLAAAGVLFLGDASGPVDPFMGEGIAIALETGLLAAPILAEGCNRGGIDAALARRYRAAYGHVIARRVAVSRRFAWLLRHRAALRTTLAASRLAPGLFDGLVASTRGSRVTR